MRDSILEEAEKNTEARIRFLVKALQGALNQKRDGLRESHYYEGEMERAIRESKVEMLDTIIDAFNGIDAQLDSFVISVEVYPNIYDPKKLKWRAGESVDKKLHVLKTDFGFELRENDAFGRLIATVWRENRGPGKKKLRVNISCNEYRAISVSDLENQFDAHGLL